MKKNPIKIALVGVGNCACSLVQGISYYKTLSDTSNSGVMHWDIAGYSPSDLEVVAAFDIDERKVGQPLSEAIFAAPNNTRVFCKQLNNKLVNLSMGCVLDGVSEHMNSYPEKQAFRISSEQQPTKEQVIAKLQETQAEVLVNYLPVGSEKATKFYMECALEAGLGVVNCVPVFIASHPEWAEKFRSKNLPIIGDDIKSQLGATITHRTLVDLFSMRGVKIDNTYQLNVGGNTDFLNMLNRERLATKKLSKTKSVQSVLEAEIDADHIHVGPSDFVPWLKDNKLCFLRIEGRLFGDVPMHIEVRLSVEDSPNSAGVVVDAIRCCKLALEKGMGGVLDAPSAFFMKHPRNQYKDSHAHSLLKEFLSA